MGALGVRIFAAMLDPFLNTWDEQFHALVAKNMMANPFKPMLYAESHFALWLYLLGRQPYMAA